MICSVYFIMRKKKKHVDSCLFPADPGFFSTANSRNWIKVNSYQHAGEKKNKKKNNPLPPQKNFPFPIEALFMYIAHIRVA